MTWGLWLLYNVIATVFSGYYSLMEMAAVSFNKVRLQYYVSKNSQRAIWLKELLQNPSKLFGTTLIGVNIATVVSSECAREFYASLGLSPDLAPLTQVAFVVVFGELAPMFAARSYPEHVGMLGSPLLYASAKLMTPLLWCVKGLTYLCQLVIGGRDEYANIFLSQDELQKILEEQEEIPQETDSDAFNVIAANIFTLRAKTAKNIMEPIKDVSMLPSNATIAQMHNLLKQKPDTNYVPIYHKNRNNIIGIALPRDMIRPPETRRVRDYSHPPWFVTQHTRVTQILQQFRRNNQSVAVILDDKGLALGIVDLDDVLEVIFGKLPFKLPSGQNMLVIDRTFSAEMKVSEFNQKFGVTLDTREELTLEELMTEELGHHPQENEEIDLGSFQLIVKKASLLEVQSVTIKTKVIS